MTNEMKLLYALCEALGFEVEIILDYKERKESKDSAMRYNQGTPGMDRVLACTGPNQTLHIDENREYTSLLINPIVDYKLTPK